MNPGRWYVIFVPAQAASSSPIGCCVVILGLLYILCLPIMWHDNYLKRQAAERNQKQQLQFAENDTSPTPTKGAERNQKQQLQYIDIKVGKGASPRNGQSVTVHYVGTFQNGKEFDSDKGKGFPFVIGAQQVIPGWDEGVLTMKVGGKRKLIVPPSLAYGPNDYGPIPGNSTLVFVVDLVSVK